MFPASSYMVRKLKDVEIMMIFCLLSQAEIRYADKIFFVYFF